MGVLGRGMGVLSSVDRTSKPIFIIFIILFFSARNSQDRRLFVGTDNETRRSGSVRTSYWGRRRSVVDAAKK